MPYCSWYNKKVKGYIKITPKLEEFKKISASENFKNVLTDRHITKSKFKFEIFNIVNDANDASNDNTKNNDSCDNNKNIKNNKKENTVAKNDSSKNKKPKEPLYAHRYLINFNETQKTTLKKYFDECTYIYNLCVDILKNYKYMTSNWHAIRDIIYQYVYRRKVRK